MVKTGRWYRIVLESGGSLEGRVRSVSLPAGLMLNADGRHEIWVAGETIEWFLRPDEVRSAAEIDPPAGRGSRPCPTGLPGHFR